MRVLRFVHSSALSVFLGGGKHPPGKEKNIKKGTALCYYLNKMCLLMLIHKTVIQKLKGGGEEEGERVLSFDLYF